VKAAETTLQISHDRNFSTGQGVYSKIVEDIFQGKVPTWLVTGMVDGEAYAGLAKLNPYRFQCVQNWILHRWGSDTSCSHGIGHQGSLL
jgi:hypothetical protein